MNYLEGQELEEEDPISRAFESIVKIHCTHKEPDYLIPWQNTMQSSSTSSGFVVQLPTDVPEKKQTVIITNAHSVEYASIIQVQKRGDSSKFAAELVSIGQDCDLAVLKVEDDDFWHNVPIDLEFGELPELQEEVYVVGFPTGGDSMSITSGVVSRIELQQYAQAGTHLLALQIDAAINAGNSGGPVLNEDGQVVGVAFQSLVNAENIGYVVPVPIVQHFLQDLIRCGDYQGFCSVGMGLSMLENESFRKSLGMKKGQSGIYVRSLAPRSLAKGILKPRDVIMELDGIRVGNDGNIPFRPGERVSVIAYLQTKFSNDIVNLKVLRGGEEKMLEVPVGIYPALVPSHWNSQAPPYLIVAGLVFTVLSVPYLQATNALEEYVDSNLSHLIGFMNENQPEDMDEVIILCQVLAHKQNLGYDKANDWHLTKCNGIALRNLKHFQTVLEEFQSSDVSDEGNDYLNLEFGPDEGRTVILERSCLDQVTKDVCEEHSIRETLRLL